MTSSFDVGSSPNPEESSWPGIGTPGGYPPGNFPPPNPAPGYAPPAPAYTPAIPEVWGAPAGQQPPPEPPPAEEPSTADVAKDQAANVASGAGDAAQHVAGVAKDQVKQVAAETGKQAKQLLGQAQSELTDQAATQQQRAAAGLHSVGDQLHAMAGASDQPGMATDLAQQAGEKAHQFAGWLEDRDPGSVLNELRSFARQRPGVFFAIALGAGVVAGRLARGLTADPDEAGSGSPSSPSTPSSPALYPGGTR